MAVGIAISMWKENGRVNENSVKFRLIRQKYQEVAVWADTAYYHDPKAIELLVGRLEAEKLSAVQAEATAREKVKEAQDKKQRWDRLRKSYMPK